MEENNILELLKTVNYPGFSRDIVSFGIISQISYDDGLVHVKIELSTQDSSVPKKLKQSISETLLKDTSIKEVNVSFVLNSKGTPDEDNAQTNLSGV